MWNQLTFLKKNYKIIVLERNEDNLEKIIEEDKLLRDNKKALIIAKKIKPIKLSSTIIREKIKNGEEVESFFKKEVLEYINKNGLYKL